MSNQIPVQSSRQLQDLHLLISKLYSQLAETEQIALDNKEIATTAQQEAATLRNENIILKEENSKRERHASEYELIANIFLQFQVGDLTNLKSYLDLSDRDFEDYSEEEYQQAMEYNEFLVNVIDKLIAIRKGIRGVEV